MKELSLIGGVNSLSYGVCTTNILHNLHMKGCIVNMFPLGPIEYTPGQRESIETAMYNAKAGTYDPNAPCIRLWHQHDLHMFVGRGKHIGWPIFELDTFTESEAAQLSRCDELIVCSEWAKQVMEQNLGDSCPKTHVINLGVNRDIFYEEENIRKPTIYLNIGKWETRKGHDILPMIWEKTFANDPDAELWLMIDNPFFDNGQMAQLKSKFTGRNVTFIPRLNNIEQVADVIRQADCAIFPSRAEGWNLPLLECMSCGKHAIATNYSAHTEMTEGFISIEPDGVELAYGAPGLDDRWFTGQGNWAKLGETYIDKFVNEMKLIHTRKQTGQLGLNCAGIDLAKRLSWENTAESVLQLI